MRPLVWAGIIIAVGLSLLLTVVLIHAQQKQRQQRLNRNVVGLASDHHINSNNSYNYKNERTWLQEFIGSFVSLSDESETEKPYRPTQQGYLNFRKLDTHLEETILRDSLIAPTTSSVVASSNETEEVTSSSTIASQPQDLATSNGSLGDEQAHGFYRNQTQTATKRSSAIELQHNRQDIIKTKNPPIDSAPSISKMHRGEAITNNNNEPPQNVKCHNNKYDRLIAQKISLNDISRPIITSDGRFDNPFPTWKKLSMVDVMKFVVLEPDESSVPKNRDELDKELPLIKPNFSSSKSSRNLSAINKDSQQQQQTTTTKIQSTTEEFRVTWIGHATLLIQVDGYNILTDPVFSERASFTQYFGPKRIRQAACDIDSLPPIDIVLISHNHYDHLDSSSVKRLNDRFGRHCRWVVPLGIGEYLQSMSVENYVELDWWQKDCFLINSSSFGGSLTAATTAAAAAIAGGGSTQHLPYSQGRTVSSPNSSRVISTTATTSDTYQAPLAQRNNRLELDIYLTPSQHWSRRGVNDINKTLWGSFTIVNRNGSAFFFAGDTGYCSAFKEIGKVFGPFAGAAIPIGAYKPRWFLKTSHVDPAEAIQIHRDLRSLKSIAIHHSTFILSYEHYLEPARLLKELMEQARVNDQVKEPFVALKHGETMEFCKTC